MRFVPAIFAIVLFVSTSAYAQRGGRGGGPPATGRAAAAIDLTGYWVSVINEDWRLRMVTPPKGQYDALTLNGEGRRVGNAWDPDRDEKAGEQCKAYGAANVMRLPGPPAHHMGKRQHAPYRYGHGNPDPKVSLRRCGARRADLAGTFRGELATGTGRPTRCAHREFESCYDESPRRVYTQKRCAA